MNRTQPVKINSFDCAIKSMGVAVLSVDWSWARPALTPMQTLEQLEQAVAAMHLQLDAVVSVQLQVWDLGDVRQAWQVAPVLKHRLLGIQQPDVLVYEFQMNINDKSRMVSTMLAYHYAGLPTHRVAPAAKNQLVMALDVTRSEMERRCPITSRRRMRAGTVSSHIYKKNSTADLSIQTFLKISTDSYRANKLHSSCMLEWWLSVFGLPLTVPESCLDDAADAFVQAFPVIRRAGSCSAGASC